MTKTLYILKNNGADSNTIAIADCPAMLKKLALECCDWFALNEFTRLSIYVLSKTEFKWENVTIRNNSCHKNNEFALVEHTAPKNRWIHESDGITFTYGYYSPDNIFDDKDEFKEKCDFYIAKEIFCGYFNQSDAESREEYGNDWVGRCTHNIWTMPMDETLRKQLFSEWKQRVTAEVVTFITTLAAQKGAALPKDFRQFVGIPHYVVETVDHGQPVVGITYNREGTVKFTSANIDECYRYLHNHYPKKVSSLCLNNAWRCSYNISA